jgi:hypothetical protein
MSLMRLLCGDFNHIPRSRPEICRTFTMHCGLLAVSGAGALTYAVLQVVRWAVCFLSFRIRCGAPPELPEVGNRQARFVTQITAFFYYQPEGE